MDLNIWFYGLQLKFIIMRCIFRKFLHFIMNLNLFEVKWFRIYYNEDGLWETPYTEYLIKNVILYM